MKYILLIMFLITYLFSNENSNENTYLSSKNCLRLNDVCISSYEEFEGNIFVFKSKKIKDGKLYMSPRFKIAGVENFQIVTLLKKDKNPELVIVNNKFKKGLIFDKYVIIPHTFTIKNNDNLLKVLQKIESNIIHCSQYDKCKDVLLGVKKIVKVSNSNTSKEVITTNSGKHTFKFNGFNIQVIINNGQAVLKWSSVEDPFTIHTEKEIK